MKKNPTNDTGKTVALVAVVGAAGYGLYAWWKAKEEEPPVEFPETDIRSISISVIGEEWPTTDLRNIEISVIGVEYPLTDIRSIVIGITPGGIPPFPTTDLRSVYISVTPGGELPPPPVEYYTLTISVYPYGAGSVKGAGEYEQDTYATIEAIPKVGYQFDYWGGDVYGLDRVDRVYMDRDKHLTAYFKVLAERYTITLRADPIIGGWVTITPDKDEYDYGDIITLTAHPLFGFEFDYWDKDGAYLSSYSPVTTAVLGDHTITAHF